MERREHYDPEDIEQLLLNRSFNELLEEERAYVLRHLGGREEYEDMRSLLHNVQRTEPDHELLDADPAVRDNVLRSFREQHKPQWRVWLNSIGTVLLPNDATAIWRPALALAGLALAIGVGIWMLGNSDGRTELAEVKQLPAQPTAPPAKLADQVAPVPSVGSSTAEKPAEVLVEPAKQIVAEQADAAGVVEVDPNTEKAYLAEDVKALKEDADRQGTEDLALAPVPAQVGVTADSLLHFEVAPAAANSGYQNNWSMANAQGTVTREVVTAKRKKQQSGKADAFAIDNSLAADDGAMALLRAAW